MQERLKRVAAWATLTLCAALVPQIAGAEAATAPGASASDVGAEAEAVAGRYDVGGRSLFLVCVGPTESDSAHRHRRVRSGR